MKPYLYTLKRPLPPPRKWLRLVVRSIVGLIIAAAFFALHRHVRG